jgi:hypothetical protein
MEARKMALGVHHPDTLTAMSAVAGTLHEQGEVEEAFLLHGEVLSARRMVLGPKHLDTLMSASSLADTLRDKGELEDAGKLQQEVRCRLGSLFV